MSYRRSSQITHAEHAIDDHPALTLHEFSLLLTFPHQLDKPVLVQRHHGRQFMLAFPGSDRTRPNNPNGAFFWMM